jgi:hypothetical protein
MGFAFLSGALAYLLKSKCSRVKCCCLEIIRDIDAELEEGPTPLPGTIPASITDPVPVPERRSSLRSTDIDTRIAEAVQRYQSIHALNQPSRPVTRSNSFA